VSGIGEDGHGEGSWSDSGARHEEFQALAALATTGELTEEEWRRLDRHLIGCRACRKAMEQYAELAATVLPGWVAAETSGRDLEPDSWPLQRAEAALRDALDQERDPALAAAVGSRLSAYWQPVGRSLMAAAVLFTVGLVCYQTGRKAAFPRMVNPGPPPRAHGTNPEDEPPRSNLPAPALQDRQMLRLRVELLEKDEQAATLKERLSRLDGELARQSQDLDQSLSQRAELNQELAQAQDQAQTLEARLGAANHQSSEDTAQILGLKTRISDLSSSLEDKDKQIAAQQELLDRDRDIRNLIGARNLYIAEIYDVGKSGNTEKPFGRIFYTKDKSLIFYGYDLDQQRGTNMDTAFQAWGRRGAGGGHDVSLGLLYLDDSNRKRWVLKCNDGKTIAQLDAIFITAEPEGGSSKPTGQPLLFTYLRLDANHP
jgi:hypothetical protein